MTGGFVGASVVVNAGALAAAVVVEVEGSSLVSATIAAVKPPSNFKPTAEFSSLATKLKKQIGTGGESGDTDQGRGGEEEKGGRGSRGKDVHVRQEEEKRSFTIFSHPTIAKVAHAFALHLSPQCA